MANCLPPITRRCPDGTVTVDLSQAGHETLMVFTQAGTGIAEELQDLPANPEDTSEHGWNLMFIALAQAVEA